MIGSPIDAIRFWKFVAVLGALLLAWLLPTRSLNIGTPFFNWFHRLSQRRSLAICIVGLAAFSGNALVSWRRQPVPTTFDEFSYLLAADTFSHGRATNPTPPLAEFFETPEVLVRPTFQSKYPPGQALFLALGQRISGSPLLGVWLSSALACGALCWMLQAWITPAWAFYGGLLVALHLAWSGPWAQSYWGGMVAALGGALLYGALRRIVDASHHRAWDAICFGLGIVILANTRPFEGLLATAPAFLFLLIWIFRTRHQLFTSRMWLTLLPIPIILLAAGGAILRYNHSVTGDRWTLPYVA